MKAVLRWGWEYAAAAAFVLSPVPALAQDPGQAVTQNSAQPANNAVGPRELQNFNLQGTVTQPAPTAPAATAPAAPAARAAPPPAAPSSRGATTAAEAPARAAPQAAERAPDTAPRETAATTVQAPPALAPSIAPSAGANEAPASPPLPAAPSQANAGGHLSLLPWLLAVLLIAAGGIYLFRRNRSRLEYAGAAGFDAYEPTPAPVPQPTPKPMPRAAVAPTPVAPVSRPAPTPRPAVAPAPFAPPVPTPAPAEPVVRSPLAGIVSTRLRPWIELSLEPISCVVDDQKIAIEFELELVNSGNAPARSVLVEARLVNAGREQDQHLSTFFANPVGEGQRIVSIDPLKRVAFRSAVVADRQHLQIYDVDGRKVFVPLLAFNVLYRWSSGEGQSSLSYLIGRETKGEKMAPFRADLGDKTFQGLAKQLLPVGLRQ